MWLCLEGFFAGFLGIFTPYYVSFGLATSSRSREDRELVSWCVGRVKPCLTSPEACEVVNNLLSLLVFSTKS